MKLSKNLKVVICADYLGNDAIKDSITGYQRMINEWVNQAGFNSDIEVVVYCLGTCKQEYKPSPNVTFKQYKPFFSNRALLPLIPPVVFPYLIDFLPVNLRMVKDIIKQKPDVIHTFQTFSTTDVAGYLATKIIKWQKRDVRLINTVIAEVDTSLAYYTRCIVSYFYKTIDSFSLFTIIKESALGGYYSKQQKPKLNLSKFFMYAHSGISAYFLLKFFEFLGIIQDNLIKAIKLLCKFAFPRRYNSLIMGLELYLIKLREISSTSVNQDYVYWHHYLTKPLQLIYDFMRRGDETGSKVGFNGLLANIIGWILKKQISLYLNQSDGVTISRPDDIIRYHIQSPVWELPLGCDLSRFKVYQPSLNDFIERVNYAVELEMLSPASANALIDFVSNPQKVAKKPLIYVGKFSDDKNISLLMDVYESLLKHKDIKDKVHFIFIGAGIAAAELEKRFGNNITIAGLVPNHLLPDIYNFVRLRNGFFVSASDTQTYGIAHEEATACGLPLVAMERGTRKHFYCPEDRIGDLNLKKDTEVFAAIQSLIAPSGSNLILGLNGLCIPDYSNGTGLAKQTANMAVKELTHKSLLAAIYGMITLPNEITVKMSHYASELALKSKFGADGTWKLLRNIYRDDWESYYTLYQQKQHIYL